MYLVIVVVAIVVFFDFFTCTHWVAALALTKCLVWTV